MKIGRWLTAQSRYLYYKTRMTASSEVYLNVYNECSGIPDRRRTVGSAVRRNR